MKITHARIIMAFLLLLASCRSSKISSDRLNQTSQKLLIINVRNDISEPKSPKGNYEEGMENWIAAILMKVYGNQKVSQIIEYPVASENQEQAKENERVLLVLLNDFYAKADSDKFIFTIAMRYHENPINWWISGQYPKNVLLLNSTAASEISVVIKDFKNRFKEGKVCGFSYTTGASPLLRSLETGGMKFDKLFLFYPPRSEADSVKSATSRFPDTQFRVIMSENGFSFPVPVNDKAIETFAGEW